MAEVFEKFIDTCLEYYRLDPSHYFSSSELSWDAMLKMNGIELELILGIDMHLFIEKGMRGGISYTAKRYSKANNKYMQSHDANKPSKFLIDLDANNLYGRAMSQYLPYSRFEWLSQKEMDKLLLNLIGCNFIEEYSSDGYILEVNLECPDKLHELHNYMKLVIIYFQIIVAVLQMNIT